MVDQGNGDALISGTPTSTATATLAVTATNGRPGRHPDAHRHRRQRAGGDQRRLHHVRGRGAGHLHGDHQRIPAPSLGETGALPGGDHLARQRGRDGHPGRHPGCGDHEHRLPDHPPGHQRHRQCDPGVQPDRGPAPARGPPRRLGPPTPTSALAGGNRLAATPDGLGYWIVGYQRSVTPYGTAVNYGSMGGHISTSPSSAWPPRPTARATGWWPPTAACSPSVMPCSRFHRQHQAQQADRGYHQHDRRQGLLDGGLRRRRVQLR